MSYYIKLRRAKQTYFIVVVPSDTIGIVKQRLAMVAGCSPEIIGVLSRDNKTIMTDDTQLGVGVEVGQLFYFVLRNGLLSNNAKKKEIIKLELGQFEPLQIIELV